MSRPELSSGGRLVLKLGSATIVGDDGEPDKGRIASICQEVAAARARGIHVVVVSSGAIAAGMRPLGIAQRPSDIPGLQAAAAVGQGRLYAIYADVLAGFGVTTAQVLLTRYDFMQRQSYLNARNTFERLLSLGVVPVVNENDTVAVDEISFSDNDRLAALVSNLVQAQMLLLLTDARGVHERDPAKDPHAPVIDEVETITPELERAAGARSRSGLGSGGMASKIAAAWVATFSGVPVTVAGADEPGIVGRVVRGERVGTYFHPHRQRASARRLWIAFAQPPRGTVLVDEGAREAMVTGKKSLLPVGVVDATGAFEPGDTVDVCVPGGRPFARGLVRFSAHELAQVRGRRSDDGGGREVIHRDQLVILEGARR